MATKRMPFEGINGSDLMHKILNDKLKSIPSEYSANLRYMIDSLLKKDQRLRPDLLEIFSMQPMKDKMAELRYSLSDHWNQLKDHQTQYAK